MDPEISRKIDLFLTEVRAVGNRTNLVGSTRPDALARHLSDSLAASEFLPRGSRVVDLGSGAGFPGIPLAITRPDLELTLVEIRERRFHFLRHVARVLQVSCGIERRRLEDPLPDPFDFALLRAVAPPIESARLGARWLRPEGEIWVWAGRGGDPSGLALRGAIPLTSGGRILRLSRPAS